MTTRMAVYYRPPHDPDAFEKRYIDGHLPLVGKWEKISSFTFNKVTRTVGAEFPYAYAFFGSWTSKDDWKHDFNSEQMKAAVEDVAAFATEGFDVVVYEELA